MTLEEIIKQRLAKVTADMNESATVVEAKCGKEKKTEVNDDDEVVVNPEKNDEQEVAAKTKKVVKEDSTVPEQVSALLEAEGLSDEFKVKAVTIFEAAVADRVLQIEARMKEEFDTQLTEAVAEIENDIDGFVTEAAKSWQQANEVAIKQNFKTQMNESLIDGLMALLQEHNIDLESGKEDALETALTEVAKLEESVKEADAKHQALQEQINSLTAASILESFRSKMTQTEFDRFGTLTESIAYTSPEQYEKQLSIVLENFGVFKPQSETTKTITEDVDMTSIPNVVESTVNSNVAQYANFIKSKKI